MQNEFISIQEAAKLSGKSIQTIRRAIKAKRLKFRRNKTPQGFNYRIEKASLIDVYKLSEVKSSSVKETLSKEKSTVNDEKSQESSSAPVTKDDFQKFTKTLDLLVRQHGEERQNFLRLVNTLQEKIFVLENQMNLLAAPKKSWYQFWK